MTEMAKRVKDHAVYKRRSHGTHFKTHVPEIKTRLSSLKQHPASEKATVRVILLGSSMLERFRTTGKSSRLSLQVQLLSTSNLRQRRQSIARTSSLSNRLDTLNLGVGGDRIENVLYRISLGLLDLLQPFPIALWILHIGGNDLHGNQGPIGLRAINRTQLLLEAILAVSSPDAKIIFYEIFPRKDIDQQQVNYSNTLLWDMVQSVNARLGRERIFWERMPEAIDVNRHYVDQVHLNVVGYEIWERILSKRIKELLDEGQGKK